VIQNFPTEEGWRTLARQALKEKDPEELAALAQQIVEADQGEKRKGPRSLQPLASLCLVRAWQEA